MQSFPPHPYARRFDAAVIGGGIFGLVCALMLARAGKCVVMLERHRIWSQASAVNAGSLAVQNKLPALVPYTLWAWELWKQLGSQLDADIGLAQDGGYKIAMHAQDARRLIHTARAQRDAGLEVYWQSAQEIRRRAPWLSADLIAATFSPHDGFASPTRLGPALRRAVERAGVVIVEDAQVQAMTRDHPATIMTTRGAFQAHQVAITAGAWSGRLAALVGIKLPVSLDVNMVSVTEPARATVGHIVTHARGILTVKQVANGSCLIGGGWQGSGSLDDARKDVNYDQLVHNLRLARAVIPGLGPLNIVRSWAGYEGVTPDSLPILGRLPGCDHFYCAACARGGFTLGPLMGTLLAELMLTSKPSKPIDLFDPGRFAHVTA